MSMASFTALRSSIMAPSTACSNSGACGGSLPASSDVSIRELDVRRLRSPMRVEVGSAMMLCRTVMAVGPCGGRSANVSVL